MEYRRLGKSGLNVPVFSFGTATFGGTNEFFKAWGSTDVKEAKRLVDISLEAGVNLFDTANGYSEGASEEILGQAIEGKRNQIILSTKSTIPQGPGPNDYGSSRFHIMKEVEASLRRLRTDHIDIYHMHQMDAVTPVEETLSTLDALVKSGKIRYIASSNFSAWHLMKSLAASERGNYTRYVAQQIYYSLVGRDAEHELMPLGLDQGVGAIIWSPLAGGALTGKIRRDKAPPRESRLGQMTFVHYEDETLFRVVDEADAIAKERGKTITQVALNWLLRKPNVSSIIIGARNEEQLKQNLAALEWKLTDEEVARLDKVSAPKTPYPYWHQQQFKQLVPDFPSIGQ